MWPWPAKADAGRQRPEAGAAPAREQRQSDRYLFESLEPRLLLSGDPVLAELARWSQSDAQVDDTQTPAVIVQELDEATESRIEAIAGDSEPEQGAPAVDWPAQWQTADTAPAGRIQVLAAEQGHVDLMATLQDLVSGVLDLLEAARDGGHGGDFAASVLEASQQLRAGGLDNHVTVVAMGGDDAPGSDGLTLTTERLNALLDRILDHGSGDTAADGRDVGLRVELAELADGVVAEYRDGVIYLDSTAAGHGWFVDGTMLAGPADNGGSGEPGQAASPPVEMLQPDMPPAAGTDSADGKTTVDAPSAAAAPADAEATDARPAPLTGTLPEAGEAAAQAAGEADADSRPGHDYAPELVAATMDLIAADEGHAHFPGSADGPAEGRADLLSRALELLNAAMGLSDAAREGLDPDSLIAGVLAASHRLQEANRAERNELRKDNNHTRTPEQTGGNQGSPATVSSEPAGVDSSEEATPRGPPAITDVQTLSEDEDTDDVQQDTPAPLYYQQEPPVEEGSDANLSRAPPAGEDIPDAFTDVADMPRAPPAGDDTTDPLAAASDSDAPSSDALPASTTQQHDPEPVHYLDSTGTPVTVSTTVLTDLELLDIVTEAIARWNASGLVPNGAPALTSITFLIADLAGDALGAAAGSTITIDTTADGFGWFVDPTPADDTEFSGGAPAGVDLLTVVLHEIGHVLGYGHPGAAGTQGLELMVDMLGEGVRLSLQMVDGIDLNAVIDAILATLDSANPPAAPQVFDSADAIVPNLVTVGTTAGGGVDLQLEGVTLTFAGLSYDPTDGWDGDVQVEAGLGILLPGQLDIVIVDDNFGTPIRVESATPAAGGGPRAVTFIVYGDHSELANGDVIAVLNSNEAGFDDTSFADGKTITVVSSTYDEAADRTTIVVDYDFDPGSATWTGGSVIAVADADPTDDADLDAVFGTIYLAEGDNRSLLRLESLKAADLGWPAVLDIKITDLKLEFADFRVDDSDSLLKLTGDFLGLDTGSAAVNKLIRTLFNIEGSVSGLVLDMDILALGHRSAGGAVMFAQNPIVDISGVSGKLTAGIPTIGKIVAGFILKQVGIDANGNLTTDTAQTVQTITYLAVTGALEFGGTRPAGPPEADGTPPAKVGAFKFGLNFAISEKGPLQLFIYSSTTILLDPASGLAITQLRGGIRFNSTIEDLQVRPPYTASDGSATASGDLLSPVEIKLTLPGHNLKVGDEFRIIGAGDPDLLSSGPDNFVVTEVDGDVITYLTGGNGAEPDPNNYTFGGTIEVKKITISDPLDLRDPGFQSTKDLTLAQWEAQLDQQVVNQANAGDSFWDVLFDDVVIEAGATVSFAPRIPEAALRLDVDLLLDTNLHLMLTGQLVLVTAVKIPAKLYADLSDVSSGSVTILFLADLPQAIGNFQPLVVMYAGVTFETIVNGVPATLDALTGFPAGVGTDVTAASINDLSGTGAGPWEVTLTLDSTTVDSQFAVGDSISAVGSNPDAFNGTFVVTGVTSTTVSFVIGSVVLDGRVDVDRNGSVDAQDDGDMGGIPVIDGLLDFNRDGTVDADDDGEIFNVTIDAGGNRRVVGYAVIDGYLDIDGDAVAGQDPDDDAVVGQDPATWTDGFDLTRAIIDGKVDVDGDGVVDADPDDIGSLAAIRVLGGLLDMNRDGFIDDTDDGRILNVVIDAAGNRTITSYNVVDGYIDVDGDIADPAADPYTPDADDDLALNPSGTDLGGYWIEPGFAVANGDELGDGLRISLIGGVDLNIPFATTLSLSGSATWDFIFGGAEDARIDFAMDMELSETNVGAIGTANGQLTITMDAAGGPVVQGVTLPKVGIWGAVVITSDFSFMEQFGLFANVSGILVINSTDTDQAPITLQTTSGFVTVTPTAQTLSIRMDGSIGLRIDFNGVNGYEASEQMFLLQGSFAFSFSGAQGFNVALFSETGDPANPVGPATLQLGPAGSPWLQFNVFGFLAIQKNGTTGFYGVAANLILSLDAGAPGAFASVASVDAQFVLLLNTIGEDVNFVIPAGANDPSQPSGLSVQIPRAPPSSILDASLNLFDLINGNAWTLDPTDIGAPYILIHLGGTDPATQPEASLNIGPFSLEGQFSFLLGAEVDPTTLSVTPLLEIIGHVDLDIGVGALTLFQLEGDAFIRYDSAGLVAAINMTQRAGAAFPGSQLGFTMNSNFRLELNTTSGGFDHDRNSLTPAIAPGFRLHMDGTMDIASVLVLTGTFDLTIDQNGAMLHIDAHFDLFGVRADFLADALLTEQGFILNATLSLATPGLSVVSGLFNIQGGFSLSLNTITGSAAISVHAANDPNGAASVNLMGLVMSGKMTIGIDQGQFYIHIPSSSPLTLNFFNVATAQVSGSFNYNPATGGASGTNAFLFSATAQLTIGEPGVLGVQASLTLTFDSSRGSFTGSVSGTAWIAFISFNASASLSVSGTAISLYLSVSVTITPGFWVWTPWGGWDYVDPVRATYSHRFNIGSLTPPEEITPPSPPPPVLARVDNGNLYLHMGVEAALRDLNGDWDDEDASESFRVTHVSGVAGNEEVLVDAFGFQQKYAGVAKIIVTDASFGEDVIDIAAGVQAAAEINGGAGDDRITYLGSGRAILNGDDDNDVLTGGSGGTLAAPDMLHGGNGNDRVEGGTGYSDVFGDAGNDIIVWNLAGAAVLGTIDGGTDTGLGSRDALLVLAGNGADAATVSAAGGGAFSVAFGAAAATAAAVEGLILDLMDGSDTVTINDVSASSLASIILRLGQNAGGTGDDGKQDSIVLQAGTGTDNIRLESTSQLVDVFDAAGNVIGQTIQESVAIDYNSVLNITIEQSDADGGNLATGDLLTIFGNGGNDTIDASLVTLQLLNMRFVLGNEGGSLFGSAFADRIEIDVTGDTTGILNIDGMGGGDSYVVNLLGGNTDTEITIADSGATGTDTLVVNGTGGAEHITLTATRFTQGSNTEALNYSGLEAFIINTLGDADEVTILGTHAGTTTVNSGSGADRIAVRTVSGATTINTGSEDDQIFVGSQAGVTSNAGGNLHGIGALLTVNGDTGTDLLDIDDSGDTVGNGDGLLTATRLSGLGLVDAIDYGALEDLVIRLGSGPDAFVVQATHAYRTTINGNDGDDTVDVRATAAGSTTRIHTQGDDDVINLSDAAGTIDSINGLVVIDGGLDDDTINIDDAANSSDKTGLLTATTLRGLAMEAGVDYSAAEDLNIWLGTGTDTFYIDSTHAGSTQLYAGDGNAAAGQRDDTIAVRSISGPTTLHGQGGNDGFLVNAGYSGGVPPLVGSDPANDAQFTRTHENNIGAVLNLHGEGDSDLYTVNLAGSGESLINVHDNGAPGNGNDTLVINGADSVAGIGNQPDDTFLLRLDFVALLNDSNPADGVDFDRAERVNYDADINAGLTVNGRGGDDAFYLDDNSTLTTLTGGSGADSFQIGQVFGTERNAGANIAPADVFDTTPVIIGVVRHPLSGTVIFDPALDVLTDAVRSEIQAAIAISNVLNQPLDGIAYLSNGVSHDTTVLGGAGNDDFSVYRNTAALWLEGGAGNDDFTVRAFAALAGSGPAFEFVRNAPLHIDGAGAHDAAALLGTPFNDSFVVTGTGIFGAGLTLHAAAVEHMELDALEGDDTIYVLGTAAGTVTSAIGGQGSDTISVLGDVVMPIVTEDPVFTPGDQDLGAIQGPLLLEGGVPGGVDRALAVAVLLPGELDPVSGQESTLADEAAAIDRLNVFHTDNVDVESGMLHYRDGSTGIANTGLALTGFGMGGNLTRDEGEPGNPNLVTYGGGISHGRFEIIEILLGPGEETLAISATAAAAITAVHGGGGDDTINISGRGAGPLVVYGDTSEDGVRYSNASGQASAHGSAFNNPGNDTIDASAMAAQNDGFAGVVVYGGPGQDAITGSQDADHLAGGSGPDTISGEAGADHIYGDSHFNVDLLLFAQDQVSRFDSTTELALINAMFSVPSTGPGAADSLNGGAGNDVIFGDHGMIGQLDGTRRLESTGSLVLLQTVNIASGAGDTIHGDGDNDFIFGGTGGDTIYGDAGSDLVFGDHGSAAGNIDPALIGAPDGAGVQNPAAAFTYLSDISAAADASAAADTLYGGSMAVLDTDTGRNILLGQQGADTIHGGGGDDDIYGGHNVAGGTDGADRIDGAAGNDVILGDNGLIERSATAADPRFAVLQGTLIYAAGGMPLIDATVAGSNPAGVEARRIALYDHDASNANAGRFGADIIAGGADDDVIFGQLGDDTIHGDGRLNGQLPAPLNATIAGSDIGGDDYIEGNGGGDHIYGGLGQDDIVGGSSGLYNLSTPFMRPDGADLIYGGNADLTARNNYGETVVNEAGDTLLPAAERHARDADMILGDNGNIYRLTGTNGVDGGSLLTYNYDNYAQRRIVVRAAGLLDYTPGGHDYDPSGAAGDNGAGDLIRGESGDDAIYGMVGADILYGDAQDDDIIAGYGHDWVSGGTGSDGVLGDDGRIYTSRNTAGDPALLSEPLYGIYNVEVDRNSNTLELRTPGDLQQAFVNTLGELTKHVNLTPFNLDPSAGAQDPLFDPQDADDIIYGGLGDDFLHGGAGDDAMSGAEALVMYYTAPVNNGDVLRYGGERAGEFAAYDEFNPLRRILVDANGVHTDAADPNAREFLLNFDANDSNAPSDPYSAGTGYAALPTDGDDRLFGDLGNDWLVGGTGKDHLYGGRGDDLLNADDDHDTTAGGSDPRANDQPDTHPSYEDIAYGGAGRDVLIANTGGDRLIDWVGEFNSYLVPFAPYGAFTISRSIQPQLMEYLYDLSKADGADQTRAADTGADALRNGEPEGEIGLVMQKDFDWQAQTGAPDDLQPGNIPGGERDVVRGADFNSGSSGGFVADSGLWTVDNGRLAIAPEVLGADAVSVFYVDSALPNYFEIRATINAGKPTAGLKSNTYLIFDYQGPTDFKFAGINISTDKLQMGHRTAEGWIIDEQAPAQLKPGQDYNVLLALNGTVATLVVDNSEVFSHVYPVRTDIYGVSYGLNAGMVGIGSENSVGTIDNVAVQVLPPELTLDETETFDDGLAGRFTGLQTGSWTLLNGRYTGLPAAGEALATSALDLAVRTSYLLRLGATLNTQGLAGLVFDQYGADDYKFAALSVASDEVIIGHYSARGGWQVDASVSRTLQAGQDYDLEITLEGTTVSVVLDGQTVLGHAFNAPLVDGAAGLLAGVDGAAFDSVTVQSNDPQYFDPDAVVVNPVETYRMSQPAAIPDLDVLVSSLQVTDSFGIADIDVALSINHSETADLRLVLVAPDGTRIELVDAGEAGGAGFAGTVFDDAAADSVVNATAPYTGSFHPLGDLGALEGMDVNGTWRLEVHDLSRRETGTLEDWSLIVTRGASLLAAGTPGTEPVARLAAAQLAAVVDAALLRLAAGGTLDGAQVLRLQSLEFEIVDLSGATLGLAGTDTVYIDATAAGFGWFVDATPGEDTEFADPDGDGVYSAMPGGAADGRMDLLSAVMHELGHVLGLQHGEDGAARMMSETLAAGTRTVSAAELAQPQQHAHWWWLLMLGAGHLDLHDASAGVQSTGIPGFHSPI